MNPGCQDYKNKNMWGLRPPPPTPLLYTFIPGPAATGPSAIYPSNPQNPQSIFNVMVTAPYSTLIRKATFEQLHFEQLLFEQLHSNSCISNSCFSNSCIRTAAFEQIVCSHLYSTLKLKD